VIKRRGYSRRGEQGLYSKKMRHISRGGDMPSFRVCVSAKQLGEKACGKEKKTG